MVMERRMSIRAVKRTSPMAILELTLTRETRGKKATIIVRVVMRVSKIMRKEIKVNKIMRKIMEATMAVKKLSLFHAQLSQDMTRLAERMLLFPTLHLPRLRRTLKSASSLSTQ